jgi:hypothetical protein
MTMLAEPVRPGNCDEHPAEIEKGTVDPTTVEVEKATEPPWGTLTL